ncbi:MAG: alpha/beta fold hydrolase [bacterium]|nr:alpha/beta fold hydrolase [bacterium]
MRHKINARPRRRHRRHRGPGLWGWLGLGALGLAVTAMLAGNRRLAARSLDRRRDDPPEVPPLVPPTDTTESWIPGPAGTLRVLERHRDGRLPVVFVHGLAGRAEQWSPQLAAAGPALHTVAVDLPGHGGSDPAADGDYSIPALAGVIGAVVDGLRCRRTILVAHSLGASAAIEYAGSHPRRIAGLLLVDPSGDQSRESEEQRRHFLDQLRRDPAEELDWYFRQMLMGARPDVADLVLDQLAEVPVEIAIGMLEGSASYNPLVALDRYDGPVVGMVSDLNTLPISLHNLRPDLPVRRVGGASHWLMMDQPDEVWALLVDLLEQTTAREGSAPATPTYS